jgi:anti-sigma-K factor RskA
MSGWTPEDDPLTPEEADLALAGEYVLGLLEENERRAFEARLPYEPALRARVAAWSEDFVSLMEDVPAVAPPRMVEEAILGRLFPDQGRASRQGWSGLWSTLLGGAAAAALASVVLVVWTVGPALLWRGSEPEYAARIVAEDGSLVVEARFDADTRQLEVQRMAGAVPVDRDLELWLIQGEEVRSLGVIPREETGVIEVRAEMAPGFEGGQLALSLEPVGGSPTGVATGPVVAVGPVTGL